MSYHYRESGLDNIVLENGYTIHKTAYGEGVSIQDTEGLHKAIAAYIVDMACPINGAELRFLRLEMELTQKRLAEILGADEQAVRRWEKARARPISGPVDRLLRALYIDYALGDGKLRAMVDRLAELDCVERAPIRLREADDHWALAA
jgi:Predicted transcriptional regulator